MVIRRPLEASAFVIAGLVIGGGAAFALSRFLASLLFAVEPSDPLTCAAVAPLVFAVAIVASWRPAWRAARIDALEALNVG